MVRFSNISNIPLLATVFIYAGSISIWANPSLSDEPTEIVELERMVIEGEEEEVTNKLTLEALSVATPGNFAEKLAMTPGINIHQRGAFSSEPMIRGLGYDRVATAFNGLRLPNGSPTRTHAPLNQFGGSLSRTLEVFHILPSLTFGPPVTGGWIQQNTRIPDATTGAIQQPPITLLGMTYYPNRNGTQANILYAKNTRPLSYSTSLFHNRFGNYSSAEDKEIPSHHEDWGASFSVSLNSKKGIIHSLDTVYRKQLFTENASLPLDVEDGEFWALTASHALQSKQFDDWMLKLRYGYSESEAFLSNQRRSERPVLVSNQASTQAFHADLRWQMVQSSVGKIQLGIDTNDETRLAIRQRGPTAQDFIWPDIHYEQVGVFVETQSQLFNQATLRFGLRYDQIQSEAQLADQLAFGKPIVTLYEHFNGSDAANVAKTDSNLSANVQLNVKLDSGISFYGGMGSSAQSPAPTERYRAFLNALGGGFELGNPTLQPERKWEYALGAQINNDQLTFRVDGYYYVIQDYIWRQQVGLTTGILPFNPPQSVFSYRNVDAVFSGMELSGTWKINSRLSIPFAAEWVEAQLHESGPEYEKGDSLPELPPATIRLSALWNWETEYLRFEIEGLLQWVSSQKNELVQLNPIYTQSDSFFLQDIYLKLKKQNHWVITLGIRNLFNQSYTPYLNPPASSIRASTGNLNPGERVPGAGREAILAMEFNF